MALYQVPKQIVRMSFFEFHLSARQEHDAIIVNYLREDFKCQ